MWVRAFMISSAMPSQKYSWSLSALMSTNGITAIDGTDVFVPPAARKARSSRTISAASV